MKPLPSIDAVPLFPEERAALLDLLSGLSSEAWMLDTVCPGWCVKDIAAHLLADDFGRLSRDRDGFMGSLFIPRAEEATPGAVVASSPERFEAELLEFINRQNESWVETTRRLSPQVLLGLLRWSSEETQRHWESLDLDAIGQPVSWAGPEPAPVWLDVARELTERWLHQSQIRDAVGAPPLYEPRLFGPVLDTFVRALPHTFRATAGSEGTQVRLEMTGVGASHDSPLRYDLVSDSGGWRLVQPFESEPDATVTMGADTAWRLFTKGISKPEAMDRATVEGDPSLGETVFDAVSIIA